MAKIETHIVLRPFQAEGREVQIGERVNASTWRNTDKLVVTKYLRPMTKADYAQRPAQPSSTTKPKFVIKRKVRSR